jgi:chromosomal replication initiator protein
LGEWAGVQQPQLDLVWHEMLDLVRERVSVPTLKIFESARPLGLLEDTLLVSTPSAFAKDWLERRHAALIQETLGQVVGSPVLLRFTVGEEQKAPPKAGKAPAKPPLGQLSILPTTAAEPAAAAAQQTGKRPQREKLNPKYTFESFVVGASNSFATAAARAVAERPAHAYNPLLIYGRVGLGKTHLLQSIGSYVSSHHPTLRVRYVTSERFTNDFISSIRDNKDQGVGFQRRYRRNDLLLVDDIQFLGGKERTQEEFFHTFNALYEAGKQVVMSSDRPPKEIAQLEDRLRSRFESGLIIDIQPPDLETRIAILQKKAEAEGFRFEADVLEFIANGVQSNIRELEGALIRVAAFSSLTGQPVTLDFVQDVLKDIFEERARRPVSIALVISEVCRFFHISKLDILSSKRSQHIVYPRQVAMYLARYLTDMSLPRIGAEFGGRDHTTVLHATRKIERLINESREVYNQAQELTTAIRHRT